MTLNIHFQVCAVIIIMFVCILYFRKWGAWKLGEKIYGGLLICTLLTSIAEIVNIFAINFNEFYSVSFINTVGKLYLIGLFSQTYITVLYLFADVHQSAKSFVYNTVLITFVALIVDAAIVINPIRYYLNASDRAVYNEGDAVNIAYFSAWGFLVLALLCVILKRNSISRQRKNSVIIIVGLAFVASVVQFMYPQVLIIDFFIALSVLIIYTFMENTADFLDPETGLYNKRSMSTYIDRFINKKIDYVMYIFSINDFDFMLKTFGQDETNRMIIEIGYFCKNLKHMHSFRFAHHQIAILAKKQNYLADGIKEVMDKHFAKPYVIADTPIKLSVSGCLIEDSSLFSSGEEVSYLLDQYMKTAKDKKQNGLLLTNDSVMENLKKQFGVEDILEWALENDKFQVYYQPIYSVEEKRYVSAEALIRLWDENNNFVSPEIFIPVAEKSGYILQIGNLVFEKVCQFISRNNLKDELGIQFIEINLSVVQCMQETLSDELHRKMVEYNISPDFIVFEITETSMIDSDLILTKNMSDLIRIGSGFALDDYGSGYSNLNYMIGLPFNIIKMDKELVWSYFKSEKGKIGLEFAIKMVKHLNMKTIAEGVETVEQLEKMIELGIEYIQGFYFSKPVDEHTFIERCLTE